MTLEQYLWRHHDHEMVDLVMAVLTTRFRPQALAFWWMEMAANLEPLKAMRNGAIDSLALIEMTMETHALTRAQWPKKVQFAAGKVRRAANEARWGGAA